MSTRIFSSTAVVSSLVSFFPYTLKVIVTIRSLYHYTIPYLLYCPHPLQYKGQGRVMVGSLINRISFRSHVRFRIWRARTYDLMRLIWKSITIPFLFAGIYQYKAGALDGVHSVKLIGWGTEKGTPYWLLVNSWNTDWGEKGAYLRGGGYLFYLFPYLSRDKEILQKKTM